MKCRSVALALALLTPAAQAQTAPSATTATQSPFTYEEILLLPMRDGARLQTVILRPRDANGPLPVLLQRTPYGVPDSAPAAIPKSWAALAKDGYIFVFQSMRGRFKSDGVFTLSNRDPPRRQKGDRRGHRRLRHRRLGGEAARQ